MSKTPSTPFHLRLRKISASLSFVILVALFLLVVLWDSIVQTTPVGHASVLWRRIVIGTGDHSVGPLSEGLHLILPWNQFYTYDLRLQNRHTSYQVVSRDGLHFEITLSFRWRVVDENVVELNRIIGPEYVEKLLVPEIGSVARGVIARFDAEALVTNERNTVQDEIYKNITDTALPNGILARATIDPDETGLVLLTDVLIRRVELPEQIKNAIEKKLEQAQVVEEYVFRVQRERLESQRKSIEAEGIRTFQQTIAPAISESYLKWRGIEATLRLAESTNSKVVIFGNSDDGLPVILDMKQSDGSALPLEDPAENSGRDSELTTKGFDSPAQQPAPAGPPRTPRDLERSGENAARP